MNLGAEMFYSWSITVGYFQAAIGYCVRMTQVCQKRTVGLSPHSRHARQNIPAFRLASIIPIPGFLIFVFPEANIAPRSQIRLALLIEVWMLEIAVIR